MNRPLVVLCFFLASVQAADISAVTVNKQEVENAITRIQNDVSLTEEDREIKLESMNRTLSLLDRADEYKARTETFVAASISAPDEAARLQAEINKNQFEENTADGTMPVADLEQLIQRDKIDLENASSALSEVAEQLRIESTRVANVRNQQEKLKKDLAKFNQQLKAAPNTSSIEKSRTWQLQTEIEAISAQIRMLDEEMVSRPMRLKLLNVRQEYETRLVDSLGVKIKRNEQFAIELRKSEVDKAQSAAETALQDAAGKHPLILQLAQQNTDLSNNASKAADKLRDTRARELRVREEANLFESDLKTFERKFEIVGMSRAMGQVLREQQTRLPRSGYATVSASQREEEISNASLLKFEYEEERRRLRDVDAYVLDLSVGLPSEEVTGISEDLYTLVKARKELIEAVLDAENSYLRALGELEFAERRLQAAAKAYRGFVSEKLLWIRTMAPLSWDTFKAIPTDISRIFAPRQWIDLLIAFPVHFITSPATLFMLVLFGLSMYSRSRFFTLLKSTGDQVGSVTRDQLRYSYQALGLTMLLALQWPFLVFTLAVGIQSLPEQSAASGALGTALASVSYYFFGFEVLRLMTVQDGLGKRHFSWSNDTLIPLHNQLVKLERVFIPAAIITIVAAQLHNNEGDSVVSMFSLIAALSALAFFFYRMPSFVESSLSHLLASGQRSKPSIAGRLLRQFLVLIPCLLIIALLLGYGATSIKFLQLLLLTIALFSLLLIAHEFGIRWLRLMRARLLRAEHEAARAARIAAAAAEETDDEIEPAITDDRFDNWDMGSLDDDGRKLLTVILGLGAIVGIWLVWADVLPALGILNTIDLWSRFVTVDGKDLEVPVTLADIIFAVMVGFVGYVAVQRMPGLLEIVLRQKMDVGAGTVYASTTLFRYVLITLVVVTILSLLGGSWSQIQWAVAALSVGIGFGLQEIVANFISGLILLFEQPIRVGDTVTVGETSGVVTRIRMRATTIRDWDRRELLVPNKEFITGRLLNWSLSDQLTRFVVVVGVAYGTNLKRAMELAIEAAEEHPEVLSDPAPFITFDEFGDNSLQLALRCFMGSVDKRLTTSSQIRLAINDKFNEAGIVVAFPQRDVHLDTSEPLEVNLHSRLNRDLPDPEGHGSSGAASTD